MSSTSSTVAARFLPTPLTAFVGRERELAGLRAVLARRDVRLLTVTGPGGVGKTRLAIEAARELADGFAAGARFVPLAPLGSPDLVLPAIARTLGIGESHPGGILPDLTEQLASTEVLLVLDNLEHVLAAGPDLALLLAACPALTLLVTSRAALHVSGEHEFAVPPLPLPVERGTWTFAQIGASDAVRLFVERAEAVQAGFRLTPANAWDAAAICRRLDGLPLAIELAAARVKAFPPHALLARLERRLPFLTGGPRDAPARLRTVRDAIAWSHDLLDADEQRLFRRVAVFVGGFTLDAAIEVAGDGTVPEGAVVDGISSLVDKSLVLPAATDDAATDDPGEPRFSMLETVREFALERLSESGEEPRLCAAHADLYRRLIESAGPELEGPHHSAWLDRLDAERDNLRSALAWSIDRRDAEGVGRYVVSLGYYWVYRGRFAEGQVWAERVLELGDLLPVRLRVETMYYAGYYAHEQGRYAAAQGWVDGMLALCRESGDERGTATALFLQSKLARSEGGHDRAVSLAEEALALSFSDGSGTKCGPPSPPTAWASNWASRSTARATSPGRRRSSKTDHAGPVPIGDERGTAAALFLRARALPGARAGAVGRVSLAEEALARFRRLGERECGPPSPPTAWASNWASRSTARATSPGRRLSSKMR